MTTQVSNIVRHRRHKYSIVACSNAIGFRPEGYGLNPHSRSTACWSGYWCEYNTDDECLTLQKLYINDKDGN